MKKICSITLAVLMVALMIVPVFAAGGSVTFVAPSAALRNEEGFGDAYCFVKPDPANDLQGMLFHADPDGRYVCYDGYYLTPEELTSYEYSHLKDQTTYSPVTYETGTAVTPEDGDVLVFYVLTSRKYNPATVTVLVNGAAKAPNADGSYAVTVDKALEVRVVETSDAGYEALQRRFYSVKLVSGEGYNVRPLKNEGYHYTFFDDSFSFRVQIKNKYSAASIKVCVVRDVDLKHDEMGEFDSVGNLLGRNEEAVATGVDVDGCRTYRVDHVTSDCKIVVTGVKETKKMDILSILKRILRMILKFFGVEVEELEGIVGEYTVAVDNQLADRGVTCKVLSADTQDDTNNGSFTVGAGSTVSFSVTRPMDQDVNVTWTGLGEDGYSVVWKTVRDEDTATVLYTAIYNLDNVKQNVTITISE